MEKPSPEELLKDALEALEDSREIDELWLKYGYKWIDHYLEPISDEEWLEIW